MEEIATMAAARRTALAAAMGAGVLLGGAGFAEAETLSFLLERSGPEPISASQTMSFSQFNPALGNLTGVTIAYTPVEVAASVFAGASVNYTFGGEFGDSALATTSANLFLYLDQPSRNLAIATPIMSGNTETATASCVTQGASCNAPASSNQLANPIAPNPVVLTNQFDLDTFIGLGTVDLIAELEPQFNHSEVLATFGATANFIHHASWGGDVSVTYTYTETVSTPEPASLALFGSALGLAGLLSRRRRG